MANVTSVTNHFLTAQEGFTTTTSGSVASGATTVGLNSVTGYSNGDNVAFVIDPTDTNKKQVFTGVIDTSGVQVTGVKWTEGTNQTHAAGATVVDYTTATHQAALVKGLEVSLDQDGTLKAGAVDNAAALASDVVTTAKIADASVTPAKLNLSPQEAVVTTSESTSSGTWGDLTTTTDSVTVTIGANGLALVTLYANYYNNTSTGQSQIAFTMSGANTASEDTSMMLMTVHQGNYAVANGATFLLTGLTAGSTTFKMKYRRLTAGTSTFSNRRITVVPL